MRVELLKFVRVGFDLGLLDPDFQGSIRHYQTIRLREYLKALDDGRARPSALHFTTGFMDTVSRFLRGLPVKDELHSAPGSES